MLWYPIIIYKFNASMFFGYVVHISEYIVGVAHFCDTDGIIKFTSLFVLQPQACHSIPFG